MSTKDPMIGNKLLSSLRVVDLKEELEKRGLSKSGTKKDLAERLRNYVNQNEVVEEPPVAKGGQGEEEEQSGDMDEDQLPSISMQEKQMLAEKNPFLRDYFQSQAELFHTQKVHKKLLLEEEARKGSETMVEEAPEENKEETSHNGDPPAPVEVPEPVPVPSEEEQKDRGKQKVAEEEDSAVEKPIDPPPKELQTLEPEASGNHKPISEDEKKPQKNGDRDLNEKPVEELKKLEPEVEEPKPVEEEKGDSTRSPRSKEDDEDSKDQEENREEEQESSRSSSPSDEPEGDRTESEDEKSEESSDVKLNNQGKAEDTEELKNKKELKEVKPAESPPKAKEPEITEEQKKPSIRTERSSSATAPIEEEVLDYGEEEKIREPQKYEWAPRTLRVKNKHGSKDGSKWKHEPDPKMTENINSEFMLQWFSEVKLPPAADFNVTKEEKSKSSPENDEGNSNAPIRRTVSLETEDGTMTKVENITITRRVSLIPMKQEQEDEDKELSPPRNPPSELILVLNLTRPFTLPQLKELLGRTGTLEELWVDKIKSKCIAKYSKQEEAFETRAALHGIQWPQSNPKALHVDYTTQEVLDDHKALDAGELKPLMAERPSLADNQRVREWDVGKPSKIERKRSRSGSRDRDRKRSRRSRSRSPSNRRPSSQDRKSRGEGREHEPLGKALDELFRKTQTTPSIYWLPLAPTQIAEKEELRRQRMIERERRLAELNKRPR